MRLGFTVISFQILTIFHHHSKIRIHRCDVVSVIYFYLNWILLFLFCFFFLLPNNLVFVNHSHRLITLFNCSLMLRNHESHIQHVCNITFSSQYKLNNYATWCFFIHAIKVIILWYAKLYLYSIWNLNFIFLNVSQVILSRVLENV